MPLTPPVGGAGLSLVQGLPGASLHLQPDLDREGGGLGRVVAPVRGSGSGEHHLIVGSGVGRVRHITGAGDGGGGNHRVGEGAGRAYPRGAGVGVFWPVTLEANIDGHTWHLIRAIA